MTALFLSLPPSLSRFSFPFVSAPFECLFSLSLSLFSSPFAPQNPTKPTLHRPCLYNVMACASIVLTAGHHSSCAPPLRDSLSAFVWHFITPPDCRIKHPAKGISTLSACTILLLVVVVVVLSCVHFHEDYFPDSFHRVRFSPSSAENQNSIPPPRSRTPPLFLTREPLCRSMTRPVIQEGERERRGDGQRRDSMELWQVEDGRPPWPAIVVSNLPADIRCRVTRVANAIGGRGGRVLYSRRNRPRVPSVHPSFPYRIAATAGRQRCSIARAIGGTKESGKKAGRTKRSAT